MDITLEYYGYFGFKIWMIPIRNPILVYMLICLYQEY